MYDRNQHIYYCDNSKYIIVNLYQFYFKSFSAAIKKFWKYAINKKCVSTSGETNNTKRKPHKGTERRFECCQKDVIVFLPLFDLEILFKKKINEPYSTSLTLKSFFDYIERSLQSDTWSYLRKPKGLDDRFEHMSTALYFYAQ